MTGRDIEKSICREMSGDLEQGMLAVGQCPGVAGPHWQLSVCSPLSPSGVAASEPRDPRLLNPGPTMVGGNGTAQHLPARCCLPSCPSRGPGGLRVCRVCVSGAAPGKGAVVRAPVGAPPAPLLEEDDSYPAKFPLKIHPCRQLSDVCDGNTWKDFYLQQQNRPWLRKAG